MTLSIRSGRERAVLVTVAALVAGTLAYAGYAALSPSRLTDPADASAALQPSASSAGSATPSPTVTPSPSATARFATPVARASPTATRSSPPASRASPIHPSNAPTTKKDPPTKKKVTASSFRVEIPSLDAALPVVAVGVAKDGQMAIPDDPSIAGWYRFGPGPTSQQGASVISAHVDSRDGVGPLSKLDRLGRGDRIVVTVAGEQVGYVVDRVDRYAKTALDLDALFSRTGPARLHLVSCGGEWNPRTRHYEDNVVVVAQRTSVEEAITYRGASGE